MWWLVLLLAGVPSLARIVAHVWFVHVRHVLDHRLPDDLPKTAGEWLRDKLEALGLTWQLGVVATNKDTAQSKDAFHVGRGVIQLTEDTHFKRDPVYWAIAAHELGHARFRLRHPRSVLGSRVGMLAKSLLVKLGIGLAAGNVLLAVPAATTIAFWCLFGALVLHAFELFDEVIASGDAWRMLKQEPALTREHLHAARSTLAAAFTTYLLPFLAHALMLSQWWIVERLTAVPHVPSGGLTTFGVVVAAITSVYAVVFAVLHAAAAIGAPRRLGDSSAPAAIVWVVSVTTFVVLGWDRHPGAVYAWCVLLAFCQLDRLVQAVLELPSDIALIPLMRWARQSDRGIEMSTVFRKARTAGLVETREGNRWLERIKSQGAGELSAMQRIWVLNLLLVLPMTIRFWM